VLCEKLSQIQNGPVKRGESEREREREKEKERKKEKEREKERERERKRKCQSITKKCFAMQYYKVPDFQDVDILVSEI
jgi:hypothetical protein